MTPRRRAALRPAVVTLGPVAAPVVRTGGQVISGEFVMRGVELFVWHPDADQRTWLIGALTIAVALAQNALERWRGRKLVGTSG